ncbi:phosphoribosyltransferase domain-containing protein [Streptomyces sp. NPDC056154]|uniref:phosphoribosyltransferase n=1 Tax=unclassified Streptomyces TaxID=2593676 RepID=UPI0035D9B271
MSEHAAGKEAANVVWSGSWVAERLGVELVGDGSPDGDEELRDLLGLALRRNPKRAHLLVSNVLGKHVPQKPSVVYAAGFELGRRVRELLGDAASRRAVVLGYAETATGLGHAVADGLGVAPYLHSTRRPVEGVERAGGFEESHSHATSHLLLPENPALLAGDRDPADADAEVRVGADAGAGPGVGVGAPLVLVDDEFSTGNTVLNTIRALHERYPRSRYVVVALVDMRSTDDHGRLTEFAAEIGARVDLVTRSSGTVTLPEGVLEKGQALVAAQEEARSARPGAAGPPSPKEAASGATASARPRTTGSAAAEAGVATGSAVPSAPGSAAAEAGVATGSAVPSAAGSAAAEAGVEPGRGFCTRVDLQWPAGVPDGGRHGFTPAHRATLEPVLPAMAARIAAALGDARRVLVLGFEELMYAPLRLGTALEDHTDAEVRYSTTTRSPVLAVDDPGYAIRTRLVFPAHDNPADGPGDRYAYNVAGAGFDAVVVAVDSSADTPELHSPGGLLAQLGAHADRVLLVVVPSYVPSYAASRTASGLPAYASERQEPPVLPEPLRGPAFSSYAPDDVGWLLQDLSDVELEAPTEEREEAIQSGGAHYAESLPVEYQPSAQYQGLFKAALELSAARVARAVGTVTETVLAERTPRPVLVSLARAGTPVGVLMRHWARHRHGLDLPHYAVSIVRGRGIDANALRWLAAHHDPADVVFVDGWTGKGAITRELSAALAEFDGFNPEIAVLADPGGCVRTYGTREDFLIPSACLNSTVSGLISRTVLRSDLVGPDDFHGAKFYRELADSDVSGHFLDTVAAHFDEVVDAVDAEVKELLAADRAPTWEGWAAVERISEEYGIHDVNLVKPGVGETTRVLLRRVPWKILAKRGAGADLEHIRLLAEQRDVPVEEVDGLPYTCVGLIHPKYTRGATGADGKAVESK